MRSLWNDQEAAVCNADPLALRVYTSRLLGREPSLVLHGGGNTSVKIRQSNLFGEHEDLLYVKGSGWDLATIEVQGFAPVRMATLLRLAALERLADAYMVRVQRSAMTDPDAPTPSVEAILHAVIPFRFVDHTHADAVIAVTNTTAGASAIRDIYGDRVLVIPYVMPGFVLARAVYERTRDIDWKQYDGIVLLNHGVFSFAESARESYERMIGLVTQAEEFLAARGAWQVPQAAADVTPHENLRMVARVRREVSRVLGAPLIARSESSPEALAFANRPDIADVACRGPLTPDHVIHTKPVPLMLPGHLCAQADDSGLLREVLDAYARAYRAYFERNALAVTPPPQQLDVAPRWAVWPGYGVVSFGPTVRQATIVADIVRHTMRGEQRAEALGGWVALPEREIFAVEYWELEQAKLRRAGAGVAQALRGKIALVTGAASGIGKACVETLRSQGAAVAALDIQPRVCDMWTDPAVCGMVCDATDRSEIETAVAQTVRHYGGLDIVVANAGIFPSSQSIEQVDDDTWSRTIHLNLTSQMFLFRACTPYLMLGVDPSVVVIASKNVPAPGPGAAAYSASKAGLTQLARVLALELGPHGIRVNVLHPHAVMDTGLWTPELLSERARRCQISVEQYKKNNLLQVEVHTHDVSALVCALAGPLFAKTTGAQIPVDGGSDRII